MDLLNIIFGGGHFEIQYGRRAKCILLYSCSLPVRKVCDFIPNIHGWKRPRGRLKTRWADSIKHDLHSAGLNNTDAAQMVFDRPQSSTERDRNIFCVAAPTFFGSRKQIGRFINCFTVVIMKFKMTTILDLIWSISPQRVVIAKLYQSVCVLHHIKFDLI